VPLRIVHKNGGVKSYKEQIVFIEDYLGIRLNVFQKELIWVLNKFNRCKKWG